MCLGNICRSPTAEAVFNDVVNKAGVAEKFSIDSCGTGGGNPDWYKEGGWSYHEGVHDGCSIDCSTLYAPVREMQLHNTTRGFCLLAPLLIR